MNSFGFLPITRTLLCLALAAQFAWPAGANDFKRASLVEISRPYPLAGCDDGFRPPATGGGTNQAVETSVAVNPTNPKNIVAAWIANYAQSIVAAVSWDGGKHWQRVPIPGITVCSGGT